ncbi:hypothetical protein [Rhizobium sp. AAP116]|uniref:hypothetical protein n=1 Tax=Rhizobium sp. AAP116 TaxID=1523429 RepID=UPI0006B94D6F|nr:hypothetical protein [Rhizobium sp. AAP116]KPF52117.1 hypothetical protein IP85_19775 [Rhizobium sp. AAP116]
MTRRLNLRQGDILVSTDYSETNWKYAFVLTADCDLWNQKFGNYLTVIPIVDANFYIENIYCSDQIQSEIDRICSRFCQLNGHSIDVDFFYEHIFTTDVEKLISRYPGVGSLSELPYLQDYRDGKINAIDALKGVCSVRNGSFDKRLRQALTTMRLEHFFLNELPSVPGLGFVALLRMPTIFDVRKVTLAATDMNHSCVGEFAYRGGSLSDGLRFAVAQAFANVFSRIGLETSFEQDRENIISIIVESHQSER